MFLQKKLYFGFQTCIVNYETLIAFCLATTALAISPGPDNIYVMMQSIVNGKKQALATIVGLMTGCLAHTTLLAFGVSALIKENEQLYFSIKVFGALYLCYLAYSVFKSEVSLTTTHNNIPKKSLLALFKQGFIMNVLNPKVTIFFLAFFPAFLFSTELSTVWQFYVLGGLFILVSFLVFSGIAFLADYISEYFTKKTKAGVYLKWMQIIVFVGIAMYILLSEK